MYVEQPEPAPDGSSIPEIGEKEREEREYMRMEVERAGEVLGYVEDGKFPLFFYFFLLFFLLKFSCVFFVLMFWL